MRLARTSSGGPILDVPTLKNHLRIEGSDHDARLIDIADHVGDWLETHLDRALLTSTYEYRLDFFPFREIELPVAPVQSVTSVQYVDTSGALVAWDAAKWDLDNHDDTGRAFIRPAFGEVFPTPRNDHNVVLVTFVAGWADTSKIPESIIRGGLLLAGHLFENTEAAAPVQLHDVPWGVRALLGPWRNERF